MRWPSQNGLTLRETKYEKEIDSQAKAKLLHDLNFNKDRWRNMYYVGKRKKSRARPVGYYLQERRRILFDDVYIVLNLDFLISEGIQNKHASIQCFLKYLISPGRWIEFWND